MKTIYTALAVLAASAELASATFFDSSKFSCPANTNNECNPQQSTGFNWDTLNLGPFQNYGDFSFSGWSCAGSFGSGRKRDVLTGRTFQDKCITGKASHDKSNSPSFGCGSSQSVKDFSVTEFEVSVEFDCELEFHFEMPDKSSCKQKSHCSKGGSIVKNSQCGGAKSVTVVYPPQTKGPGTGKTSCNLGIHSMKFDCSPPSSTKVYSTKVYSTKSTSVATPPATTLATTTSVPLTSSSVVVESSSSAASSTSSVSIPETTPVLSSTTSTYGFFNTSSSVVVPSSSVPEASSSSIVVLTSSSAVGTTSAPSSAVETTSASISSYTSVDVVTVSVSTSTTVCPVTLTHVTGGTTSTVQTTISHVTEGTTSLETTSVPYVTGGTTSIEIGTTTSTIVSTVTSTVCTKCSAASVTEIASTTSSAQGPIETAPCPAVLPSCLNTWLFSEGCSSNTDAACYCPSAAFVKNVFDCLPAHAADDNEIAEAQTYFQGICAPHIPQNPAIVTGATTALTTTAAPTASSVPVTTIQVYTTLTVPCVESTGISSGSIIPSSSTVTLLSTYLTVPQVIFTTVTGYSTVSANLVPGTPASNPATTTPAQVYSTVPIPTGTLSVSKTAAGNVSATATPSTIVSTGSGAQNAFGLGASFAALIVAVLAL
ncbi:hypothetical protein ONS96_004635 [Cadophora gregata f. sp. sojae]|nr:hypothetical protein ONS96_004635 [Cadophora gregata f. sp. sojae]